MTGYMNRVKWWAFMALTFLLFALVLGGASGCASLENARAGGVESEYLRMFGQHKQKSQPALQDTSVRGVKDLNAEQMEELGDGSLKQGNAMAAFLQYQKAVSLDPKRITARYKLGVLSVSKGMPAEGMKQFEEILKIDPENAQAFEGQGRVHLADAQWEKSKESFSRAVELDPNLWQSHAFIGYIHEHDGNYDAAAAAYGRATALNGKSFMLWNNLGMSCLLKKEYKSSAEAFQKALKIDPENQRIQNNLGVALFRLGKHKAALDAFTKAGDRAGAYNNMGCFYLEDGQYGKAAAAFRRAIEAKPSYYDRAHENLKTAQKALAGGEESGLDKSRQRIASTDSGKKDEGRHRSRVREVKVRKKAQRALAHVSSSEMKKKQRAGLKRCRYVLEEL